MSWEEELLICSGWIALLWRGWGRNLIGRKSSHGLSARDQRIRQAVAWDLRRSDRRILLIEVIEKLFDLFFGIEFLGNSRAIIAIEDPSGSRDELFLRLRDCFQEFDPSED